MDFCVTALQLAKLHHEKQMYGTQPYVSGHLDPVAFQAELIASGLRMDAEEVRLVVATAYLHDILEDTNCKRSDLVVVGIPKIVVDSVELLTKKCESHNQYLFQISHNSIFATVVKLADSMCNHRASLIDGKYQNVLKYANNINYLSTALCRWAEKRERS